MQWRTFTIVEPDAHHAENTLVGVKAMRASDQPVNIAFVFTGQGAQYATMGTELMHYAVFREFLEICDGIYKGFGCQWSLVGESCILSQVDPRKLSH